MRLLGCLSVFLCILLLGISYKMKLDIQSRQWREMQTLLRLCLEELQLSQGSSEEILKNIWEQGFHSVFLQQYFHSEGTIQQKLHNASDSLIDPNLRELAQRFAQRFGMSSLDLQLEGLNTLQEICDKSYEESCSTAAQNGKLAVNMGIFGGAAALIILL